MASNQAKWQEIASGDLQNPESSCGLCRWARKRTPTGDRTCPRCPAWHHYGQFACASAVPAIGEAIYCHGGVMGGDEALREELRDRGQEVVTELLAIKENLLEWANKLEEEK